MKSGDKIKAFVKVGLMKEPRWLKGDHAGFDDQGFHLVKINEKYLSLEARHVKLWQPIEPGVLEGFAATYWEELKEVTIQSVAKFFPDEPVRFDDNEKIIYVGKNDDLSIQPGIVEQASIARLREVPVWSVSYFVTIPSTQWQPEDADEVECGHNSSSVHAAKILVDQLWKFKTEGYWQSMQEKELQW